jgi:hypothetical protein
VSLFKYVGRHPDTLGNGRPVAPGEKVDLTAEAQKNDTNARLIGEQKLLAVPPRSKPARGSAKEDAK